MSKEIARIKDMADKHQKVDTVMYAISKENLKESAKKLKKQQGGRNRWNEKK